MHTYDERQQDLCGFSLDIMQDNNHFPPSPFSCTCLREKRTFSLENKMISWNLQ